MGTMRAMRRAAPALGLALVLVLAGVSRADVRLPGFYGDHMVLQRDAPVRIRGWADPGERVSVRLAGRTAKTEADESGRWEVELPPLRAGGPHTLTVRGRNTLRVEDVLIGDVWLCSGQSNMAWTVRQSLDARAETAAARDDGIRHVLIPREPAASPRDDVSAEWQVCSPETVGGFTGVGYFMARRLRKDLKVPVGLIHASWGGTRIEPWIPQEGLDAVPELEDVAAEARAADGKEPANHQQPTVLHDGMVQPLVGYGLRGIVWYQGESNHRDGRAYVHKTRALVEGWRGLWGDEELPFHFVQIAPFDYRNEDPATLPTFWEAQQAITDELPGTAMVVINDVATVADIHPPDKQTVGERLALVALARLHGKDVAWQSPRFREMEVADGALRVVLDHAGKGLRTRDGLPPGRFEIAGANTGYLPADATIDGDAVVLRSPAVPEPVAMRFAWDKVAQPNLVGSSGLPVGAFRAGELPRPDFLGEIDGAGAYALVYDIDLADLGPAPAYAVDRHAEITAPFHRVAYLMELRGGDGRAAFVWVSMDAFTDDPGKIGIPTAASGAHFQQAVANLTVASNVPGVPTGAGLVGSIEFWPNHYGPPNSAEVPGASEELFDFGDRPGRPVDGYGSMQVHVPSEGATLFALNFWRNGGNGADIGIGSSDLDPRATDWTFARNGVSYRHKRLRVFVRLR